MSKRRNIPRLMRDLTDKVNIDRFMRQRGIDVGSAAVGPDTRLSSFVGAAAVSAPIVRLVASDHVRMGKPNRVEPDPKMKHHRVDK